MIKKILTKIDGKVFSLSADQMPQTPLAAKADSDILDCTNKSHQRIEGRGTGYLNSVIITGSTDDVTVENCVCTLRSFNGTLIAKNSTVYVDGAAGAIQLERSDLELKGSFKGRITSTNSYIKIDDFFSSFDGTVNAELGGVFVGSSARLEQDGTVLVKDPLDTKLARGAGAMSTVTTEDIFNKDKLGMADYYALDGQPRLVLGDNEVIRVGDRYMMFVLSRGKTMRIKESKEVFINYKAGIVIMDADGNVVHKEH